MGKRTNKTRPKLVPHPRYGSAPRPSGITVPEAEIRNGFWRRRLRRYSDLRSKADLTRKELMTLVDDAAFLLMHDVLRDLNPLGQIKNRALREIAEYPGVQQLAELLAKARAAEATTEA